MALLKMKLMRLLSRLLHKRHAWSQKFPPLRLEQHNSSFIDHDLPLHSASMIGVTDSSIPALEEHFIHVSYGEYVTGRPSGAAHMD